MRMGHCMDSAECGLIWGTCKGRRNLLHLRNTAGFDKRPSDVSYLKTLWSEVLHSSGWRFLLNPVLKLLTSAILMWWGFSLRGYLIHGNFSHSLLWTHQYRWSIFTGITHIILHFYWQSHLMILYIICYNIIICSNGQLTALTAHEKSFGGFYINELGDGWICTGRQDDSHVYNESCL